MTATQPSTPTCETALDWVEQKGIVLLRRARDCRLPSLEDLVGGEPTPLAREVSLSRRIYSGRYLRGRKSFLSKPALIDCLAALGFAPLRGSEGEAFMGYWQGMDVGQEMLLRWEKSLRVALDAQRRLVAIEDAWPEEVAAAKALPRPIAVRRAVARFLMAAGEATDKDMVCYLGLVRTEVKHILREWRGLGLIQEMRKDPALAEQGMVPKGRYRVAPESMGKLLEVAGG